MELVVFSRRWGHEDKYKIERTGTGWKISASGIGGECDKTGSQYLYKKLDQDLINYPKELPGYMEWLWQQALEKKLSDEQIQEQLTLLSEWIQTTEKASPQGIFEKYK
jgi:hypothetical protein